MRSPISWCSIFLLSVLCFLCERAPADTYFAPETDLYLEHNAIFRSRLVATGDYDHSDEHWTSGRFEYDLDVGLVSFFRRYVYKDPNVEKAKRITFRLGYAYLPDWESDDSGNNENRAIAELALRFPMGGKWLVTDTNKENFRWIGDATSSFYRNQLRLERGIAVGGFRATPYASGEVYYDTRVDRWNRFEAKAGIEVPWRYSTVIELSYTRQSNWQAPTNDFIGLTFNKFMALPIGNTQ